MKITLQDATLSLSATDAGERANVGALFQVLSAHQGKFSVAVGDRTIAFNQKAKDVVIAAGIAAQEPVVLPETCNLVLGDDTICDKPLNHGDDHGTPLVDVVIKGELVGVKPTEEQITEAVAQFALPAEPQALIDAGTPVVNTLKVTDNAPAFTLVTDAHDEHLLSVAEGEGMTAPEPVRFGNNAVEVEPGVIEIG